MDKLQMAHEHMQNTLKFLHENSINYEFQKIVDESFDYVDVMMAEHEKRNKAEAEQKRKAVREMLNADNTFLEKEGQHFDDIEEWQPDKCNNPQPVITEQDKQRAEQAYSNIVKPPIKEWQPDWSQAPEWAVAWTFDKNAALWWSEIPEIHGNIWFVDNGIWQCSDAPSFNYQGNWKDSLRKRPTNI